MSQSETPKGLEKYKEGIDYWLMIAKEGKNNKVMNSLATEYLSGEKIVKDVEKAMFYFSLGSELGNTHSMLNLGQQFQNGYLHNNSSYLKICESYEEAYYFYSKATYKGSALGRTRIDDLLSDIVINQLIGAKERKEQLKLGGPLPDGEGLQALDILRKKIISLERKRKD